MKPIYALALAALMAPAAAHADFVVTRTDSTEQTLKGPMNVEGQEGSFTIGGIDALEISKIERRAPQAETTAFDTPANTFICTHAGTYSFPVERISGESVGSVASADWIWATNEEEYGEQHLISDVGYADSRITFTVSDLEGTAVVGAFDADGTCLWTWLVWCTDQPQYMTYDSGAAFMDRAIGATSADRAEGDACIPTIVYQRGRSVPLYGGYRDERGPQVWSEAKKHTQINPALPYEWRTVAARATVEESFANPTTFYHGQGSHVGDWCDVDRATCFTFWSADEKTDYDPCPAGYRLSKTEDWGTMCANLEIVTNPAGAIYAYEGTEAWIASGGQGREYSSGENMAGYPGTMFWNGDLTQQYSYETMGMVPYACRASFSFQPGSTGSKPAIPGNMTFAHAIRPVVDE